jgi:hypothetical protein
MKLNMTALVRDDSWQSAEMIMSTKHNLIEQQIEAGDMMRLPDGRVIITVQGMNTAQTEWDAEYASKVTESNTARLLNSLVAFTR